MAKRALIYGISGQDGQYLSQFLSKKGYSVAGVAREKIPFPGAAKIYLADLADEKESFLMPLEDFSPDEVYNLAGISNPVFADEHPALAFRVNSQPVSDMLAKMLVQCPSARFFQASSCFMFSGSMVVNEAAQPSPIGAYGSSKLEAHLAVGAYRKKGAYACSGILFNHESPRRGENFVTRKISLGVAKIKLGIEHELRLGNLEATRDWGFAGDYVEAMWLMLQQEKPDDYVIATGVKRSVRDFCQEAFSHAGLDYLGYVQTNQSLIRAKEINISADISKIRKIGWAPKTSFKQLVHMMVDEDIRILNQGGIP